MAPAELKRPDLIVPYKARVKANEEGKVESTFKMNPIVSYADLIAQALVHC